MSHGDVVREWLERYRIPFELIEDPKNPLAPITVLERLSGKSIRFALAQVVAVEEAKNTETGSPYLRIQLDDGRRFAGVGIDRSPRRYAPVNDPLPFCSSCAGSPWKITWPPSSPAPGPRSIT